MTESVDAADAVRMDADSRRDGFVSADHVRLCWFIQTHHDREALDRTLRQLRALYPDSIVVVVSDGDPDPALEPTCRAHAAAFTPGDRLFGVEHGGAPVQRMFDAFLVTDADILIKIDPDTDVRARFSSMPDPASAAIYGTVQSAGKEPNRLFSIQGGCIIVPRRAAVMLARSGLLMSDRLRPPCLEWAANDFSKARAARGLTSHDWTLGWACRELEIAVRTHPEVFSRFRPNVFDTLSFRRAAVMHPRFAWTQVFNPVFYAPRRWAGRFVRVRQDHGIRNREL